MPPAMDMATYLSEITHATESVLDLLWAEDRELAALLSKATALRQEMQVGYAQSEALLDSEDPDDMMAGAGRRYETYFGPDKELSAIRGQLDLLTARQDLHTFSRASLAGSLLQFAKQGISLVHGGLAACPTGVRLGSQHLRDIIWQGRNQSIHWEEGALHSQTKACFTKLVADYGSDFADYNTKNLAFEVVKLLGWDTFMHFHADMLSIG